MTQRRPGEPGYLGPEAEAQRGREIIAARLASPKRSAREQGAPAGLFAEPDLF